LLRLNFDMSRIERTQGMQKCIRKKFDRHQPD
jgi:hypothetical protein